MRAFYSSPKFRRWLQGLSPRDELTARMALQDQIKLEGASLKWDARITQLQREGSREAWSAAFGSPEQEEVAS